LVASSIAAEANTVTVEPSALNELCDDFVNASTDAVVTGVDNGIKVSRVLGHLKKLGNIKKRGLYKYTTKDSFAAGNRLLKKTIKKQRKRTFQRK
jgi:hypothetical protein